jgi:hypothetical protein
MNCLHGLELTIELFRQDFFLRHLKCVTRVKGVVESLLRTYCGGFWLSEPESGMQERLSIKIRDFVQGQGARKNNRRHVVDNRGLFLEGNAVTGQEDDFQR